MSHTYQSHLTVVIGNPNKEMQTVITQEAKDQGGMEEDVWFDYIREQFEAGTTQIAPHYMSHIDLMLSTMLGDDVRVAKPFNGFTQRDGRIFPVIIFYEDYIQDLEGTPISITRFTEKMIEMIVLTGAETVLVGVELPPNYGELYTDSFEKMFVDLAVKFNLELIKGSIKEMVALDLMQDDGIHPNKLGHQMVEKEVRVKILPMLDQQATN